VKDKNTDSNNHINASCTVHFSKLHFLSSFLAYFKPKKFVRVHLLSFFFMLFAQERVTINMKHCKIGHFFESRKNYEFWIEKRRIWKVDSLDRLYSLYIFTRCEMHQKDEKITSSL